MSNHDPNRGSVLVQGHSIKLTPALRKDFARDYWLEFDPFFTRQLFADPLDDYWETRPPINRGRSLRVQIGTEFEFRPDLAGVR